MLLAAPDEGSLVAFSQKLEGIPHVLYREPDQNGEITAMAVAPELVGGELLTDERARKLFANLPLLLKEHVMA